MLARPYHGAMATQQQFEIKVGDGLVHGVLNIPGERSETPAAPGLLICCDMPTCGEPDEPGFLADAASALAHKGIATVRYRPRNEGATEPEQAAAAVDDASAVFRWLMMHEAIDAERVGVFARHLGSVIAACLAGRTDQINRLCLLTPYSIEEVLSRAAKPNGGPSLFDDVSPSAAFIATLAEMKPTTAITTHGRPILVLHGAADRTIEPAAAEAYLDAIELAGLSSEHEIIALADHGFSQSDSRSMCLARICRFFSQMEGPDPSSH